jgi:hypothetical protein
MRHPLRSTLLMLGAVLALTAGVPALAMAQPYPPPPAPRVERIPPPPGQRYAWQPGHWRWNGRQYAWVGGHYWIPPRHFDRYVQGAWVRRGDRWVWVPAHWQ